MQTSQLTVCTDCGTLQKLYEQIDCSIYQLIKNKWTGQTYNVDLYFDDGQYRSLLRLKRIVYKRIYNRTYPSSKYSDQDIISVVSKLLYRQTQCPECPCIDFTNFIDPCYCYSIYNSGSPSAPSVLVEYINCDGINDSLYVSPSETVYICAKNGSIKSHRLLDITNIGDCDSDCPTTTTTTILP